MNTVSTITRRSALGLLASTAVLPASAQQAGAKVLKLGSICTLTGPNASIGKEGLSGLQYGVKKTNEGGGLRVGSDTYTLELLNADDESKVEKAVSAAERLITGERVPVIFTPAASTTTLAMLPTAEKNKTLAMSFVASAPDVTGPGFAYSFRTTLSSIMNVAPAMDFLIKEKNAKKIAYLGRNDDWGRIAGKQVNAKAKELGATVVAEEYFDVGSTDFYALLTKLRAANPDAVIGASFIEDGVSMIKQYRELQMKPIFMSIAVIWSSPTFAKAAGKAMEGIYISTGPNTAVSPELTAFGAEFEKANGRQPLPYEVTAYDTLMVVLEAVKKANSIDPTRLRDAMLNLEHKGLLQTYKFNGSGQSEVVININEVKDGRVVKISSLRTS
jgi:branched-chain amino acid transport system substrate-binding protein